MIVYAAEVNPCTYESFYGVISLHIKKKDALEAMRDNKRAYIKDMQRPAKPWEKWRVHKYEVMP